MMFSLFYSVLASKQIGKLPKHNQERIINTLERARIRPHAFAKKLTASPYFSLRVGDYRVILDIKNDQLIILVIEVGHRRNVYK